MVHIAAGGACSGAISAKGDVYMWGYNGNGQVCFSFRFFSLSLPPFLSAVFGLQIGLGPVMREKKMFHVPMRIAVLSNKNVKALAIADRHAMALTESGQLFTWGSVCLSEQVLSLLWLTFLFLG
jgi:alpha-tubulin suppressor-like RCC1 family protein